MLSWNTISIHDTWQYMSIKGVMALNELAIQRYLNDNTRKQGVLIGGEVYSLHITGNREVIITDNSDYSKIYSVQSLDFFNMLEKANWQ